MTEESRGGPDDFGVGSRVAGYRLEEQVGRGGMAVVFRAYDPRLHRYVALKILAPRLAHDEAFRRRFIQESRAAAAVDNPHIIPVFDAGEADGALFIAMRFVHGGDVQSLVEREGPLPPGRATEIISQAASALDSAHARGLVHRDVKPANMLLEASEDSGRPDHIYLSDFGLTKTSLPGTGLTTAGQFLGTVDYVAPEQIQGRLVDGRSDQYALACTAFELLAGSPPFHRDQDMAVMYAHVTEPPPLLSSRGLPVNADEVINRALAKVSANRYASCREFAAALRRAFGLGTADPGAVARSPTRPATQVAAPVRRPTVAPVAGAAGPGPNRPGSPGEHPPERSGQSLGGPPTEPARHAVGPSAMPRALDEVAQPGAHGGRPGADEQ